MKISKSKLKQIIKEELALEAESAHAAEGRALLGMLEEFLKRYSTFLAFVICEKSIVFPL